MAGVPPVTPSTKETTNYARLCRLLVDVGSQALRDTFNSIHAPGSLHTVLANPPAQTILQSLYTPKKGKKKILNPIQWGKLYPAIPTSVSSANFDITLLMILLRNICSLSPPATGWDALPPPADTSTEADIARVKYFRNVVYGHAEQASVDDTSFNNQWHDIKAALVRLGGASYGDPIDDLQNACMDPGVEEHYKELLQQWKRDEDSIQDQLNEIEGDMKYVRKKVDDLTEIVSPKKEVIVEEIANCESDIAFLAARHDPATRQWLLKDFDKWFSDPGDSRAYILLGDPGVGKSVMAGVLAQRSREAGHLGAAYFCRHNDSTRNDPRCLLGTVAYQLCEYSSEYNRRLGGEGGVTKMLGNSNLGVQGLFTKLLQEPLYMCHTTRRKLVVIDALDETHYESREDFLDLLIERFPRLPNWLLFFITSRPENTVQLSLKKYNPCVRICAGNVEHANFYQQHEQDIKLFLRNSVDFSRLPFSVDDLVKKCSGSFLYAFYIAKDLNAPIQSGKSFQLVDRYPGDFDIFLRKNFKRVFDKVGSSLFKKLFGCAIATPAPLPVSFITYVLQREKSSISKQLVLDALSLFMVLSKTFAFLHNLIPAWLTDEDKARELFIDRNIEASYLKDVILEILFGFIREHSQDLPLDLLDYVLRVGIRFLSGFPGKNSLETVFDCLTSFKYIEKRIQDRRIEIYSLIEDYKLAADCQGEGKKEILLEVCSALERNIYVLLGCPYLLHSCLQNTSTVIQDNVGFPDSVPTTSLQLNQSMPLPSKRFHAMRNIAVSPDRKLFAVRHLKQISLFDSYSRECVCVFSSRELERYLVPGSKCLEFSPDDNFLFFGRLDRWLSLKDKTVDRFPQFSRIDSSYEWGLFSLDKQCIVVKLCNFSFKSNVSCCWLCLLNYLCLWAAEEIGQGLETDESETICGCFPHRLQVQIRPSAGKEKCSPVPAMTILLNILRRTHHDEWCSLLEKLQLINYPFEATCGYCRSRMNRETITLTDVRDFIISHYNEIFEYQVWDLQTGRSALEQAFSLGVQLTPFRYLCHLGTALEKCGLLFSGIDKSPSLCNIALLNTVCHHLFFFDCLRETFDRKLLKRLELVTHLRSLGERGQLEEIEKIKEFVSSRYLKQSRAIIELDKPPKMDKLLKQKASLELDKLLKLHKLLEFDNLLKRKKLVLPDKLLERIKLLEHYQLKLDDFLEQGAQREGESLELFGACNHLFRPSEHLHHSWLTRFSQFKQLVHLFWFLEAFHFGTKTFTNAPLELQYLLDKGLFTSILPCVSPDGKWIAIRLKSEGTTVYLYRGQHQRQNHPYWRNSVHVIKEVEYFAFTNDGVFFLYLTGQRSLHTLSLANGTILTSVSGVRPLFFTPERQAGYRFQVDDEEIIILVKDFPAFFLSSFFPFLRADLMQVAFASADAVLILYSDSTLALMENEGTVFAWETSLTHSFGGSQIVKKAQFSPDGKLIATHQDTNILLYRTMPASAEAPTDHRNCPDSVFEANDNFIVLHFTISADNTLLLSCIQRNIGLSFFVWNVQEKFLSASFDSPELTSEDCCCCFSSNNMDVIICSEFCIEFWDHSSNPCRLLRRVETDVPYTEIDRFTHCTVSPENDLLAYCITDKILLCSLKTSIASQRILQLPPAHLGKVEFCQFLTGSRYLISYGVDGTVVLWDLSEWKAVAFVKIAEGRESIISMAVSSEEDKLVCVTSFGLLKTIKLCGLKEKVWSKLLLSKGMGSEKMTETCAVQVGKPMTAVQNLICSDSNEGLDVAELVEEMDFMLLSDDSEDSDEMDELLD